MAGTSYMKWAQRNHSKAKMTCKTAKSCIHGKLTHDLSVLYACIQYIQKKIMEGHDMEIALLFKYEYRISAAMCPTYFT